MIEVKERVTVLIDWMIIRLGEKEKLKDDFKVFSVRGVGNGSVINR